jgi:serine/threonine protein kinase
LLPSSLQIDDLIGQGAFSKVHRGAWTRKDEKSINVAVKAFSLSDSSDQRRDMLLKELRALIKVDCKCLVRFHGAFLQQDTVTMVLEYMDLGSIEQLLKRASVKFDEPFLASMTFQMLWGLAYLHHEKIIHRVSQLCY